MFSRLLLLLTTFTYTSKAEQSVSIKTNAIFISLLWGCLVTPINIKPSLSTNHHTKIENPALLMQVFIANLVRKLLAGLTLTLTFWNMGLEISPVASLRATVLVRWQEKGKCVHPLKSEAALSGWYHIFKNILGAFSAKFCHSLSAHILNIQKSYRRNRD